MNREEYNRFAHRWSEIFVAAVGDKSQAWQPWLNTSYENYSSGDDEIVIFSRSSPPLRKGVSIQQEIQTKKATPSIKAVTRTAQAETDKPVNHLVILCSSDPTVEAFVAELLRIWCLTDVHSINCEVDSRLLPAEP